MSTLVPALIAALTHAPTVDWTAPPQCPPDDAVLERAEALGADVVAASFSMRGRIEATHPGFHLELEVETASGTTTRRLDAGTCAELVQAASLVLSVAIDPLRIPESVDARLPPPPLTEPLPVRPVTRQLPEPPLGPSRPAAPDGPVPSVRGALLASGTAGRGISPGVDGRAQLGIGLDVPFVRAELLGFHALARRTEYADMDGVGARIGAWGVTARVGPRAVLERFGGLELAAGLGVELAAVVGDGFGVDRAWARRDMSVAAVVAPGLRIPLGARFALGVDAEFAVSLRRPAFTVNGRDRSLYRMPRLGGRAGLRFEVRNFRHR